jgi:hypothetical protein
MATPPQVAGQLPEITQFTIDAGPNAISGSTTNVLSSGVFGLVEFPAGSITFAGHSLPMLTKIQPGKGAGVTGRGVVGVRGEALNSPALGILACDMFNQHVGVYGESDQSGVFGNSTGAQGAGVYGKGAGFGVLAEVATGGTAAIHGRGSGSALAGEFIGNVTISGDLATTGKVDVAGDITAAGRVDVTGDITAHDVVLRGGDCAEDFDILSPEEVLPGFVMVIDSSGSLRPSQHAYDKRVAGVISGAGEYKPGITLDRRPEEGNERLPLALLGKTYVYVDADASPIDVGDLLTTSNTRGHAMKVTESTSAFGAVIGKALRPLQNGRGLIPILIAMQ